MESKNEDMMLAEIADLKKQVAGLQIKLLAREEDSEESLKLTYADLLISSEDIFNMIETYSFESRIIHLTCVNIAKIIRHHKKRTFDKRARDGKTFDEVLSSRIVELDEHIQSIEIDPGDIDRHIEAKRLELSISDLRKIQDLVNSAQSP
jgi:hypothetical protein